MKTDTAHLAWNRRWATPAEHGEWLLPDPGVRDFAEELAEGRGPVRALDLGCGIGRHALLFARLGFETVGTDLAEAGLDVVQRAAAAEGLAIATEVAPMTSLPFPDGHFDYVLSFNVIYHGEESIVRSAIAEIRRVLSPGGFYQGTMLSKRNANFGVGSEIAPNTFVRDGEDDKDHPHFYCNARELVELFAGFELKALEDRQHSKPGSWHWHMIAERL
jgi:tellurite methyltransferase